MMREKGGEGVLHYWPSYELVTDVFQMPFKHDRRHVEDDVLDYIMMLFERSWCVDSALDEDELLRGFITAGAAAGMFPRVLNRVCKKKAVVRLDRVMERETLLGEPRSDAALRGMLTRLRDAWQQSEVETA